MYQSQCLLSLFFSVLVPAISIVALPNDAPPILTHKEACRIVRSPSANDVVFLLNGLKDSKMSNANMIYFIDAVFRESLIKLSLGDPSLIKTLFNHMKGTPFLSSGKPVDAILDILKVPKHDNTISASLEVLDDILQQNPIQRWNQKIQMSINGKVIETSNEIRLNLQNLLSPYMTNKE